MTNLTGPLLLQALRLIAMKSVEAPYTPYIEVGDEPVIGYKFVNLPGRLPGSDYQILQKLFTELPRQYLRGWYDSTIRPGMGAEAAPTNLNATRAIEMNDLYDRLNRIVSSATDESTWAGIIEIFNEVNTGPIDPWFKERAKYFKIFSEACTRAFSEFKSAMENYEPMPIDPVEEDLLRQIAGLPKFGSEAFNVNFQNAIQGLMSQKEYDLVQSIIDAYNKGAADPEVLQKIVEPIPQETAYF